VRVAGNLASIFAQLFARGAILSVIPIIANVSSAFAFIPADIAPVRANIPGISSHLATVFAQVMPLRSRIGNRPKRCECRYKQETSKK
jgi:hypothetical protein